MPEAAKAKLQHLAQTLDPLRLLEEIRALQAHLTALADGDKPRSDAPVDPNLPAFLASLSSAWRAGEVRPTFSVDAKPRHLRSLPRNRPSVRPPEARVTTASSAPLRKSSRPPKPQHPRVEVIYAEPGQAKTHALTMIWPIVCRRLESFPNINCLQLFEELCVRFPGRFSRWQYKRLVRHVKVWRDDARARGVIIGPRAQRNLIGRPRVRRRRLFEAHWSEMLQHLEAQPDQTALELLTEFQGRYPGSYTRRNLDALQRRVRIWRQEAVQRLMGEIKDHSADVAILDAVSTCTVIPT